MLSRPSPRCPALLLLGLALAGCEDVRIKFPDTGAPDDTGLPDTAETDTDTGETDTVVPVDPFPGTTPLTDAEVILYAASPSDGVGYAGCVAFAGDLTGTANPDLLVSARYADAGGGPYSGAVYVVSDPPAGRSGLVDAAVTIRGTVDSGQFGTSMATGDFDGDGRGDVAVGAPNGPGSVYIFRGPFTGDLEDTNASRTLVGDGDFSYAGYTMASAGDVNGDGMDDVAVGAPSSSGGCQSCGAVMVSLSAGGEGTGLLDEDSVRIYGDRTYGQIGYSAAPGIDVNGDGFPEIAVGAPYSAGGGAGLLYGPFRSGSFNLSDADAWFAASAVGTAAGTSVSGADLTGDGYDELIVSAPQDTEGGPYSGKVYVELGSATRWSGENVLGGGAVYVGSGNDAAGTSITPAGDVDGDGTVDLLIGAPYANGGATYAGAAYLVLGPVSPGNYALTADDQTFAGVQSYGYAGSAIAAPGDVNGGGVADLTVATMLGATPQVGEVFLFLGE